MRVIGDAHGKFVNYCYIAKEAQHSLQLGDMGMDYGNLTFERTKRGVSENHKFFGGNHDNYDLYASVPYALGDWGMECIDGIDFFYARGAFSIDKDSRQIYERGTGRKIWWDQEELTADQADRCLHDYIHAKPELVITHGCPTDVSKKIGNPNVLTAFGFDPLTFVTNTQRLLQAMLEVHQPKLWLFGHFHKSWKHEVNGVNFQCLDELEYIDL